MIQIFFLRLDIFSLWVGFFFGLLFFWLGTQAYRHYPTWSKNLSQNLQMLREALNAGIDNRLRDDIVHWAQRQHLASSLFSLDEIVIQPRLMAPPPSADTTNEYALEELTQLVLPYMPDWPEAAGVFGAPTISLAEAAEEGASLIVMGPPGIGKSVALAHLACQMARRDPGAGKLAERFPIIVHVADLLPKLEDKKPLTAVSSAVAHAYASKVLLPRLGGMLDAMFDYGRGLLLLDGLDEVDRATFDRVYQYLERLRTVYPHLQIIAATSTEYYGHLNKLGLFPTALAAWGDLQRANFIRTWSEKWGRHIQVLLPPETKINPLLLENWLLTSDPGLTPLELTLKAWATFAGDIIRPELSSLIDVHLRRSTVSQPNALNALSKLATHSLLNQTNLISAKEFELLFGTPKPSKEAKEESEFDPETQPKPAQSPASDPNALVNAGLMTQHNGSTYRLIHPLIAGYLAGNQLATSGQAGAVSEQSLWLGKTISLGFMGHWSDISGIVTSVISESKSLPIQQTLFVVARWLRGAPRNAAWRGLIMRELANTVQKDYHTPGLGARAIVSLALSGDPNVNNLFRQLGRSDQASMRQLGVMGLGLNPDAKAISELAALTQDISANVGRLACLALSRLGTRQSSDVVMSILLSGSEEMRRAAAESLVNLGEEGFKILQEALASEDLLVRRAAIFGLMRLDLPEVLPLLEKAAIQDAQWVVRNAATQALEQKKLPNPYAPKPLPALADLPWLLTYAGKSGVGIANETQGMEMLLNAASRGDTKEKLLALETLRVVGDHLGAAPLYNTYYSSKDEMREAAFVCLWHVMASGATLPPPAQFGLG